MPDPPLGPDPTELAALHEQQSSLLAALAAAMDDRRPPSTLGRLWTRIALLDADLRRN